MTTFSWAAPNSGDWNTPTAWAAGSVPDGTSADVVIAVPGTYIVQIAASESFAVDSLALAAAQATLAVNGTLVLAGAADTLFLDAGTLALDSGGTVAAGTIVANGGQLQAEGGTLSGVTYRGELTLTGSGQSLAIQNGLVLQAGTGGAPGGIDLSAASASGITVLGSGTLDNATLNFGGGINDSLSTGVGNDSGNTLTLGGGFTVDVGTGAAYLGYQTGSLAVNDSGDSLNNAGLIAIGAGTLTVDYGTFTNSGSIAVTGGVLAVGSAAAFANAGMIELAGSGNLGVTATSFSNTGQISVGSGAGIELYVQSFSDAGGGTIAIQAGGALYMVGDVTTAQLQGINDSGSIRIDGTLDNTGQTLAIGPGGSFALWNLYYGDTILGGVIQDTGAGMLFAGGALDAVTYEGTLDLNVASSVLEVANGLTATGTGGTGRGFVALGDNASLTFDDTQTLDNATIALDGAGGVLDQNTTSGYFSANGGQAGTLTLGPNLIVDQTSGSYNLGSEGAGSGAIVNEGTIEAASGAVSLAITPAYFTNTGEIDAASGSGQIVVQGATFTNSGDVTAATGSSELVIASTNFVNTGTLDVQAGNGSAYLAASTAVNSGQITIGGTAQLLPGTITNSAGTITTEAGSILYLQADVVGGTIIADGGQMIAQGGTLAGVTYEGTLDLSAANSSLTLTGGTSFTGTGGSGRATINFNGPAFQSSYLYVLGTATLDNATIDIGNGGYGQNSLVNQDIAGTGAILTLGPNLTLDQVGVTAALTSSDLAGDGIVNEGTIIAGYSGGTFTIDATNFTNDGSIIVSNGGFIDLTGAPTAALINSITKSGGVVQVGGVVNGGTILAPTGGVGGVGGTLAGVTYEGTLDLRASNSSLTLTGGTSFTGTGGSGRATIKFNGPAFQSSYLYVLGTATLDNATIDIGNGGYGYNHLVNQDTAGTGAILTLGPNLTLDQVGATAALDGGSYAGDGIVNEGTIIAAVSGSTFYVDATNFTNDGSMVVSNGAFIALEGAPTAVLINSIIKSGGVVQIGGVVTGGTILAPTGGVGGAGGTLTAVTYEGTLDLSAANSSLTLTGGTSFTGVGGSGRATIDFNGPAFQSSYLYVLGTATLDNATLDIGNAGYGYNHLFNEDAAGAGAILTLGPSLTLALAGPGAVLNSSDLAGDGIVNEGTIIAGYAGGTFFIDATNFTNDGTMVVSNGGFMALEGAPTATLINSITKSGGLVQIGGVVNGGTILAPTGGVGGAGGTLVGATYEGTLDLSAANSSLTLTGGTSFTGVGGSGQATIDFNGPAFQSSYLYVLGTETLDNATIDIGNAGYGYNHLVNQDSAGTGAILTLGPNLTLALAGPAAVLNSSDLAGDGIVNQGTIIAAVSGGTFFIDATNFTNDGSIIVSNGGYIDFTGAPTAALLSSVIKSGGVARIGGVVNGGTILAPIGGVGGEGGTLVGVTYEGTLDLSAANSSLTLTGGTSFSGAGGSGPATINLTGPAFQSSYLYVLGTAMLDNATIDIGNVGYGQNYLINQDTAGTGAILTLGTNLTLALAGPTAALGSSDHAGDGIVNEGTIIATVSGATLNIDPATFTNDGTISASNHSDVTIQGTAFSNGGSLTVGSGATIAIQAANFTNLAGNTLTGGAFEADAGGTLLLPGSATIQTDAANLTLSGINSVIENAGAVQIDSTLGTISAAGSLHLLGGRNFTTTMGFTDNGQVQLGGGAFDASTLTVGAGGSLYGYGTILPAIANSGTIIADAGRLDLAGAVSGTGALGIDPGTTLELGGPSSGSVTFAPAISSGGTLVGGTLKIDTASSYSGTIAGFALGDTIDLADLVVTSASITAGGTLVAELSGGGTQNFALGGGVAAGGLAVTADGGTGSDIFFATLAQAMLDTTGTIDFGNVRLGNAPSQAIGVSNLSPAGGALLSAGIGGISGAATATGTVSQLAPGATDSTDLLVGINAGTVGVETGGVTVGFTSYAGAGSPPVPDGAGTIAVQGTVYRAAAAAVSAPDGITLHPGDVASVSLTVRNTDPADGYSENLLASLVGIGGALSGGTGTVDVAPSASDSSALAVSLTAGAAGSYSGTAAVETQTSGQGVDGLGVATLGTVDVPVSYVVDNYATAVLAQIGGDGSLTATGTPDVYILNLGATDQSAAALAANLEVLNSAQGPAADVLGGSFSASGDSVFANAGLGAFSGITYGNADASPAISLGTGTIGTFSEQLVLTPTGSNPSGYSGVLAAQTIDVVGTILPSPVVVVSSIAAPPDGQAGGQVPITWTLTNQGSAVAIGPWSDAVYLASDAAGDNLISLGTFVFAGTIAAGQTITRQETVTLPGTLAGNEWVVVQTDVGNQLNEPLGGAAKQTVATAPTDIASTPTLSVGTPVSGTLMAGQTIYYQFTLPAGESVNFSLGSDQTASSNGISVSYGALPTPDLFLANSGTIGVANPTADLNAITSGTFYASVTDNGSAGAENYTVSSVIPPLAISSVVPDYGSNPGSVTFAIDGSQFTTGMQVALVSPSGAVTPASAIDLVDSGQLWATADLQGLAPGSYSLEVHNNSQSTNAPVTIQNEVTANGSGPPYTWFQIFSYDLADTSIATGQADKLQIASDALSVISGGSFGATDIALGESLPVAVNLFVKGSSLTTDLGISEAAGLAAARRDGQPVTGVQTALNVFLAEVAGGLVALATGALLAGALPAAVIAGSGIFFGAVASYEAAKAAQATEDYFSNSQDGQPTLTTSGSFMQEIQDFSSNPGPAIADLYSSIADGLQTGITEFVAAVAADAINFGTAEALGIQELSNSLAVTMKDVETRVASMLTDLWQKMSDLVPPVPSDVGPTASMFPDPHLLTFDGLYYSFQTAGEFVLAEETNGGTFQVQARLAAPVGASTYSVITEVGIQVGHDVVTIDSTRAAPVWVDGQAVTFSGETIGLAGGLITKTATGFVVTLNTGESVSANIDSFGTQTGPATTSAGISISVSLAPGAAHGSVEGLLGNYNGNPNNDLTLADGTVEPTTMSTATLYGAYADSWRVTQATSLLDYGPGQTTATFTDASYPGTSLSIASFPTIAVAAATQLVQAAGITDPGLQQAAIYDYLVTGDPSVVSVEANLQQQGASTSTQAQFVAPPPPPEQVGVRATTTSQVEASSGPTTVLFEVYREGDSSQALTVGYTIVTPDSTYLGAGDFGGELPLVQVTIAAGQTVADVAIVVPNGIGTVVSKNLEVAIAAGTSVAVIAPYAQETIVNSAPLAGPQPVLGVALANEPDVLPTQNGGSWNFDLGAFKQGIALNPGTVTLAVLNLAVTGSDSLAGALVASGNGGLLTGASSGFSTVQPGALNDIANIALDTTSLGVNTEQFTITPYDVNASGYLAIMPQQTVTVTDTVMPLAQALLSTDTIDFGVVRGGSVQLQAIGITNDGPSGAEALDASVGTITGAGIGTRSFTLLAVGQISTAIAVGLDTSGAGVVGGTVAIDPASDGANTDGLGASALLPQDVTVSGMVYRVAQAGVALARTILHVGDPGTDALIVSNTDPADGYSENLVAALAGATGSFATVMTGPTGDIAAGGSDATFLAVTLSTAQAGTVNGNVTLALMTDGGTGPGSIDGLGQLALAPETVGLTATIDNYATAQVVQLSGAPILTGARDTFHLDFGTVGLGAAPASVTLGVENAATSTADLLAGTFIANGNAAIPLSGFSAFTGVAAQQVQAGLDVTLNTSQAGVFIEAITLDPTGYNAGGYSAALAPEVITVTGTVDGGPVLATGSLAVGHGQSEAVTALLDRLITPGQPGDSETIVAVSGNAVLANGVVTYTVPTVGPDGFTYTVEDQWGDIATGTVAVTVDPGPQVIITVPAEIGHGQTIAVGTLTPGLAGDTLSLTTTSPGRGTLSLTGETLTYAAPATGGADSIGYTVTDQLGDAASGTIALTVDPGPVAAVGSLTVGHGQTVVVTGLVDGLVTPGLAGDTETIAAVSAATGRINLSAAGTISYVAPASGSDTVAYTVTDQLGDSATGAVAVTIDPGPSAGTLASTVALGSSVNLTAAILGVVAPGLNGDTLSLTGDGTLGTFGTVVLASGQLTYTASGDVLKHIPANGTLADSFNYTASDQYGDTATGTVNVTVTNPATVINGPEYGSGTIVAAPSASIINAYGWNNVIFDEGGNDIVNAGSGQATVYVNTGDVVVNLAGYNNLVTGFDAAGAAEVTGSDGNVSVSGSQGSTTVDLGNGNDTVSLGGYNNVVALGDGNDIVSAGPGNGTITLGSGNDQVTIGGYWNTIVAGDGNDQVAGAQGNTSLTLGNGTDSVSLAGYSNVVQVGGGSDTIVVGAGSDKVMTGGGNDTIILQGWSNTVTLGAGTDTVNAGSGDSITVNSTTLLLKGGNQEMVFLDAGTASIDDLSSATTVVAGPSAGSASILDFARDAGFVLDLTGGVGGFTTSAGVVSALQSDGHGGMQLLLGSGPGASLIDFVNTQASVLTSAHFRIG